VKINSNSAICFLIFVAGILIGNVMSTKIYPDKNFIDAECFHALDSCVKDIKNKCSSVISYAIALENENAKLNKFKKSCSQIKEN